MPSPLEGSAVLNRAEFDVKYGSGSFFDNLGDNLIHDNFTVGFNLVASRPCDFLQLELHAKRPTSVGLFHSGNTSRTSRPVFTKLK